MLALGILFGTIIGYTILPRVIGPSQVTTVTIEDGVCTFTNNRKYNGDRFFVIVNRDTILDGILENEEWK